MSSEDSNTGEKTCQNENSMKESTPEEDITNDSTETRKEEVQSGQSTPTTEGPASKADSDEDTFEKDIMDMLKTYPQQNGSVSNETADSPVFGAVTPPITGQYPTPPPSSQPDQQQQSKHNMARSVSMPIKQGVGEISKIVPTSAQVQETLFSVKKWSIATFKSTKQAVNEKLGRASRTVDVDLENKIEALKGSQKDYVDLLSQTVSMQESFTALLLSQKSMALLMYSLAGRHPELTDDFQRNADVQKAIFENGQVLHSNLELFKSSLETLVCKTIEDTLKTIRSFEYERLQFDAYRIEYEQLNALPQSTANESRLRKVKEKYEHHKHEYETLAEDVRVKLRFLDDNRVRVMHKQLMFFHVCLILGNCTFFAILLF